MPVPRLLTSLPLLLAISCATPLPTGTQLTTANGLHRVLVETFGLE